MRSALVACFCLTLAAQQPADKEAALGRQLAEDVRRSTTAVESQVVQDYVARLGARLKSDLPGAAAAYTFSVVATDRANALHEPVVLPGGYVFVPVSLLLTARDEAEFGGMLAQAMARRPVRIKSNTGTIPLVFVDSFAGDSLLPAGAMDRRRDMELQADVSAVLAMSRAGLDPSALLRYIERQQARDQPRSPFPARATRIAMLEEAIRGIPAVDYEESDEFHAIQQRVRTARPVRIY